MQFSSFSSISLSQCWNTRATTGANRQIKSIWDMNYSSIINSNVTELTYCLHEWGTRRRYWGRLACGRSVPWHLLRPKCTAKDQLSVLAAARWHGAVSTARWNSTAQDRTASTSGCWGLRLLDNLLSDYLSSRTATASGTVSETYKAGGE